jgi:DMSO/TMAO reductase YedYZ molybdopterin-dependent catalytic subunit
VRCLHLVPSDSATPGSPHAPLYVLHTIGPDSQTREWTWEEYAKLPFETVTVDIHSVTKWSNLLVEQHERLAVESRQS